MSIADGVTLLVVAGVIAASALVGDRTLARRALAVVAVMLGTSVVVAALLRVVPGDPATALLGEQAPEESRRALARELGLIDAQGAPVSAPAQVARFVRGAGSAFLLAVVPASWEPALQEQLAPEPRSFRTREPVRAVVAARLPRTLALAGAALLVALVVGVGLGALAAARRGRLIGALAEAFSLVGAAVPRFFLAPVLVLLFSLTLHWLPPSGTDEGWRSLVLPALSLGTALAALLARMTRAVLLEALGSDAVRTARAKGAGEVRVVLQHALRPALTPVVTVLGLQVGGLLAGAVVTEKVFAWPGMGLLLIESIRKLDVPVVQGVVLVTALGTATMTLVTDALVRAIDPRIR